jgi:hypothetical protein
MVRHLRAGCFGFIVVAFAPIAFAQVSLQMPQERSTLRSAPKSAPCGGALRPAPANGMPGKFASGASVDVRWSENPNTQTQGCVQIALLEQNDSKLVPNFPVKKIDRSGTSTLATQVTLPAGFTCSACTLQIRQSSGDGGCAAVDSADAAPTESSYACADLCVGPSCFAVADAGVSVPVVDASAPPLISAPDSGADPLVFIDRGSSTGCSAASRASGAGGALSLYGLLGAIALARRIRRNV